MELNSTFAESQLFCFVRKRCGEDPRNEGGKVERSQQVSDEGLYRGVEISFLVP